MYRKYTTIAVILFAQSTLIYLPHAHALKAACGQFRVVKGDVKFSEKPGTGLTTASPNRKVCTGGIVVTGKDSRALVVMPGGDELHISPDSKIVLQDINHQGAGEKKKVLIDLLYGKMRANVQKNTYSNDENNQFRVKTKTAVAGVRGTQFLTSFSQSTQTSEVITFEGVVEVGKPSGSGFNFSDPVQVSAGQKTFTDSESKPATPTAVPKPEMQKIDQATQQDTRQESRQETRQESSASTPNNSRTTADTNKPGENRPEGNRNVSSLPPSSSGPKEVFNAPAMITNDDLGKTPPTVPMAGMMPPSVFVPPQFTPVVPNTICNFCNERIINGDAKVNINVIINQ